MCGGGVPFKGGTVLAHRNNGTCHKLNNITRAQKSLFLIDTQTVLPLCASLSLVYV